MGRPRLFLSAGCVLGFLAVATGAFGAHGLKGSLSPDLLEVFETGSRYAMYHALSLLATGLLAARLPDSRACVVAGWAFLGGAVVFSGTLWLLALTGQRWLGAVTPLGGLSLLVGWAALTVAAVRAKEV